MHEAEHEVVIAGGGPTGMMLAGELALAGVKAVVIERRESQDLAGSRAGGLHSRTIEVLDQRGIAERFLEEGQQVQVGQLAGVPLDLSDFPTRHPYGLGLWQNHIERLLAGWVEELDVPVHRSLEVTGFSQDDAGVDVELSDGRSVRAQYLVGCDGGRSVVRRSAGIDFPGSDPTTSSLIAEIEMEEQPEMGTRHDSRGMHALGRVEYQIRDGEVIYAETGPVRVMVTEDEPVTGAQPTLVELKAALRSVYGTDFGAHSPIWISRFSDMSRQAANYRKGRVLLAGDAAHVHSPDGGMGLNTGVQDAVNLGWKLARVVNGRSPDRLLDTYNDERHPVGTLVIRNTMAMVALRRPDDRTKALREVMAEAVGFEETRRHFAAMMAGLAVHYGLGEGHPLLGRRMPDLELETDAGPVHVYSLLHDARPMLIDFGGLEGRGTDGWNGEVRRVEARYSGKWELPAQGEVKAPSAVFIRPDGHVAWVDDGTTNGLDSAMTTWLGPAEYSF